MVEINLGLTITAIIGISVLMLIAYHIVMLPLMYLDEGDKALAYIKQKEREKRLQQRKNKKAKDKEVL